MVSLEGSDRPKVDLVLEGGGVKGIGLVGAVLALDAGGLVFPRVAGTSAGAIVASLVAAHQVAGRPLSGLEQILRSVDYRRFKDQSWLTSLTAPVGELVELVLHLGIARGDYLVEWLGNLLADLGVETFADLAIGEDEDPGSALPADRRYRLVVHTSDLSRGALVRLPWDCDRYGLDPRSLRVVDAVRASMSIPFFFRPVVVPTPTGKVTWVDGGLLSNFPITVFDRDDDRPGRWPTWGVKLSGRPAAVQVDRPADSNLEIAAACVTTLLSGWDRYHLDDQRVTERTVFVDTGSVSAVDFALSSADQGRLYDSGQAAGEAFLAARTVDLRAHLETGTPAGGGLLDGPPPQPTGSDRDAPR